jgi:hypothetical protein
MNHIGVGSPWRKRGISTSRTSGWILRPAALSARLSHWPWASGADFVEEVGEGVYSVKEITEKADDLSSAAHAVDKS